MTLPSVPREHLPEDARSRLFDQEVVHHFTFIDVKGGCGSSNKAERWLLVSNQRILFEANVREGSSSKPRYVHQSGSIPIPKVVHRRCY